MIHEALHPYPDDLVIVTKVGARRGSDGSVREASSPKELIAAVYDNRRNLGVDVLDVVNLRNMFGVEERATDAIDAGLTTLAALQRQGLVRHIGLSSVTPTTRGGTTSLPDRLRPEQVQPGTSSRRCAG